LILASSISTSYAFKCNLENEYEQFHFKYRINTGLGNITKWFYVTGKNSVLNPQDACIEIKKLSKSGISKVGIFNAPTGPTKLGNFKDVETYVKKITKNEYCESKPNRSLIFEFDERSLSSDYIPQQKILKYDKTNYCKQIQ